MPSGLHSSQDGSVIVCGQAEFPGATALWLNGALGDVTAVASGEGFDRPRSYGEAAAAVAAAAVRSGQTLVGPGLAVQVAAFDEPIENLAFVAAWALGVLDGYYQMTDEPGVNGKDAPNSLCVVFRSLNPKTLHLNGRFWSKD